MAERKSTGGAGRGFEFRPRAEHVEFVVQRWWVWWFEDDRWHRFIAPMPEGAAASYADHDRRYAGAICMELAE
jgi:hypothetical protein